MPAAESLRDDATGGEPTGGVAVRRCAVLGHPIAHSLSPALHRAAYAALGLTWTYEAADVVEAGLPTFVAALDDSWRGLSLTMPLKRAVLPLLATADPITRLVGGANTVVRDADGLHGWNTDVGGMLAALAEVGVQPGVAVGRVLVLGGGATAAAAIAALADLAAAEVLLAVRDAARAREVVELAGRCGVALTVVGLDALDAVHDVELLISTLPGGAAGPASGIPAVAGRALTPGGVLFDAVYAGWPTPLAVAARSAGVTVVSGADLLVHQAVGQVAIFTGQPVGVAVLRSALPALLAEPPLRAGHPTQA